MDDQLDGIKADKEIALVECKTIRNDCFLRYIAADRSSCVKDLSGNERERIVDRMRDRNSPEIVSFPIKDQKAESHQGARKSLKYSLC